VRRGRWPARLWPRRLAGGWAWWLLLLALPAAAFLFWRQGRATGEAGAGARLPLPPPRFAAEPTGPSPADFLGAGTCAGCHSAQFAAWERSTHGRAGGTPTRGRVIAPFDGRPIRFRDAVVTPSVSASGEYRFTVAQAGREERVFRVEGVIGGGHMEGGGTQGFMWRHEDGTLRFLPFDFSRQERRWFCNTDSRANKGWVPVTPTMSLADCGDWPPSRILGDEPRFTNCQGCHGSQISVALDSTTRKYDTRFATLAVDCESCHGPGRQHVELARRGGGRDGVRAVADVGMRPLATLDKQQSIGVCYQCHAIKDRLSSGYLPGRHLEDYYSLKLPLLGDTPLRADGRVRTFAYQEGHQYSDCYLNGAMTCTSCHDPHSQGYRDVNGAPLAGRVADGQCTGCHVSKGEDVAAHTKHAPGSPGSSCVACHMPYLQQPQVGHAVRYARSDHTIPIPRPAFDSAIGVGSACQGCHADRSAAQLQQQVTAWYGELKPHNPAVASALRAESAGTASGREAVDLLLRADGTHPMAQFAGMARFLERHDEESGRPGAAPLDREAASRLERIAASTDADVKALALATLHAARGDDPEVRRFLAGALGALGPQERAVRARWALVLGYLGDARAGRGETARAVDAYARALEITPDDPRILQSAANARAAAGDAAGALADYRRAIALDPAQPLALVNLGNLLQGAGNGAGAEAAYRRALAVSPNEPLASYNLGNVYLQRQELARAIPLYQRTVELDPGIAQAHFNLARAFLLSGDYRQALRAVRRGLEFAPDDVAARDVMAKLEGVLGEGG
jgi:tetratricopeptide (TPR) repeat protein